jgi:hypothetical protein
MAFPPNVQLLAAIAIGVWFLLVMVALARLRNVSIETKTNEMPKLMILASSTAGAVTLGITVLTAVFFPDFLQDNSGALYTAGFLGAAILLWWTFAVYWREMKLILAQATKVPVASPVARSISKQTSESNVVPPNMLIILRRLENKPLSLSALQKSSTFSRPYLLDLLSGMLARGLIARVDLSERQGYVFGITTKGQDLL